MPIPAPGGDVVTLTDAKTHLNITVSTYDDELSRMIGVAEDVIASRCGPLAPVSVTCRVRGTAHGIALPTMPAISLTSVTPVNGTALTLGDLYLDTPAGVVSYNSGGSLTGTYDVVYRAGREICPNDLFMAVLELLRHMWNSQRGAGNPATSPFDGASNTLPGAGYLLPFRVSELIAPYLSIGFA